MPILITVDLRRIMIVDSFETGYDLKPAGDRLGSDVHLVAAVYKLRIKLYIVK